jgi:hypothetical protein
MAPSSELFRVRSTLEGPEHFLGLLWLRGGFSLASLSLAKQRDLAPLDLINAGCLRCSWDDAVVQPVRMTEQLCCDLRATPGDVRV